MSVASGTLWRSLAQSDRAEPLPAGLDKLWHAAAGVASRLTHRPGRLLRRARTIARLAEKQAEWTDDRLGDHLDQLRSAFRLGRQTPAQRREAMAGVCAAARRTLGLAPYVEQIAAALAIQDGCVAEQATGEGKTLTAVLAATGLAWRARGCHIVTTNDYLARRDAEWMADLYRFCGVRVAWITQDSPPAQRRAAYQADVTYCTNKEVAADFLRDRLTMDRKADLPALLLDRIAGDGDGRSDRLVQRGLYCAIVDEADSILIDEAVTPLILSGQAPNPEQVKAFAQASVLAETLEEDGDYRVDRTFREVDLTAAGRAKLADHSRRLGGLWSGARRGEELLCQALTARKLYQRDAQYVVQDGKVTIVDDFTGRLMPDREWRNGLHQAIQAKEGLEIQPPKDTFARVSFQRFFRMYRHLAGMTGTAVEARREFWATYRMPVVVLPTHEPCRRRELPDRIFATGQAKWQAVVERIEQIHRTGAAVLVGTRSVGDSEQISRMLAARGLQHEVLNAVRHEAEAQVVAQAGQSGAVTVATNMAGRGTDIKLADGVAQEGGLHVIATERHEARRIDRQLFGRSGRQGDPGWARAFVSLEDDLIVRHARPLGRLLRRRSADGGPIRSPLGRKLFHVAQRRAQRRAARQRRQVLRTDDWLDEQLGFAGREH